MRSLFPQPRTQLTSLSLSDVRIDPDSLYPLQQWGSTFAGKHIMLRLDPSVRKVLTFSALIS